MKMRAKMTVAMVSCTWGLMAHAQTLDFEELACVGGGFALHGSHYESNGFQIDQGPDRRWQLRTPCDGVLQYTGSATMYNNTPEGRIILSRIDGGAFTLLEIKAAELNGPDRSPLNFIGTNSNGDQVRHSVQLDGNGPGNGLETFVLPNTFTDLINVEWRQQAPYHQFDDIVLRQGSACTYTLKKSKAKKGCKACPNKGDNFSTEQECEDVKDCKKKIKTTIGCPDVGNGTCKVKGKRNSCG